ncbi:MAG: hypothetical protein ACERKZ_06590 [Lachnotalea sp.]
MEEAQNKDSNITQQKVMETGIKGAITNWWKKFSFGYPKASKIIEQFVKFYLISLLVTLLQYFMLTFMPSFFSKVTDWENINCYLIPILHSGKYIFNFSMIDGGLAYFAAYGTTLFVAQCVNFPLQRNVAFKSHGNITYQIMWYVIAFVLIFMVCSGLQTFYQPFLKEYIGIPAVYNILITVINGGVQMVIYFPIYKVIFPEENVEAK